MGGREGQRTGRREGGKGKGRKGIGERKRKEGKGKEKDLVSNVPQVPNLPLHHYY